MKITSDFAILDVKRGRQKLKDIVSTRFDSLNEGKVEVTIKGFIPYVWGRDDGESIEFAVTVESVEIKV